MFVQSPIMRAVLDFHFEVQGTTWVQMIKAGVMEVHK